MSATYRYCGRTFTAAELTLINELTEALPNRAAIARAVCERLDWRRPDGRLKDASARAALLRMHRDALIVLPPPNNGNGNGPQATGRRAPAQLTLTDPEAQPAPACLADLAPLQPQVCDTPAAVRHWRELIAAYHYLGDTPLAGAQLRYLVESAHGPAAALGFAASAWTCKPRDAHIGWDHPTRQARLHLIVGNARFLVLPWAQVPNLATHTLAAVTRRLAADWHAAYGYQPVLVETFVDTARFAGTTYQAANWTCVGHTQGRGKLDRYNQRPVPVKAIYLHPLRRDYRRILTAPP